MTRKHIWRCKVQLGKLLSLDQEVTAISGAQMCYEHRCICEDDGSMSHSVVTNSTQVELQSALQQSSLEVLKQRELFELYSVI